MPPFEKLRRLSKLTVLYEASRHLPPNWSVVGLLLCSWYFSSRLELEPVWFSMSPLLSGALTACECCWAPVWRSELRNSQGYSRPGWWWVLASGGKERDWQDEDWMGRCRTRSETGSHHHMTLSTTLENRDTVMNVISKVGLEVVW